MNGSRVLVLGVAYKRDVSDYRESPALDIMELLRKQGAEVVYTDPHVPRGAARRHADASRSRATRSSSPAPTS